MKPTNVLFQASTSGKTSPEYAAQLCETTSDEIGNHLPCSDCGIDSESGTILPFTECSMCCPRQHEYELTQQENYVGRCGICGKHLTTEDDTIEDHEVGTCCADHYPHCAHCGKLLDDGEGTYFERGLFCEVCEYEFVDGYQALTDNGLFISDTFLGVCKQVYKEGEVKNSESIVIRPVKVIGRDIFSISKEDEEI